MDQKDFDRASILIGNLANYEKKFNKKNINENSILEALEGILNKYNSKGRELIFEKLERDAEKSPSEIILSNGKLSDTVLTEAISYAVNTANHIGIDIINSKKSNIDIEKKYSNIMKDGLLSALMIDNMIKNYDKLSLEDRNKLFRQWGDLNNRQKDIIYNATYERINNSKLEDKDKSFLDTALDIGKLTEDTPIEITESEDYINNYLLILPTDTQEILDFKKTINGNRENLSIHEIVKLIKEFKSKLHGDLISRVDSSADKEELNDEDKQEIINIASTIIADFQTNLSLLKNQLDQGIISRAEFNQQKKEITEKLESLKSKINSMTSVNRDLEETKEIRKAAFGESEFSSRINSNLEDEINSLKTENETILDKKILQKIQQLTISFAEKFSKQEISEALGKYSFILENLDEEDIEALKGQTPDEIKETLDDAFQNFEEELSTNAFKILQHMASLDFEGNLQQILTNPELLQETFLPALNAEIQKLEQSEKSDVEQNEQSFEENKPSQYQEQSSSTFNQETIRDELSAIPVALSNIEGIDKADIIAGMQGYKQLLDSIDASTLQGKSNEDVLKILMSKAADIGLEGNANEILLMMSQIGFSKDGNMQIADILAESKETFTALVDEASKEENIDKAIQENKSQAPITDKEAMPGMRSLVEDLRFAKENENQLGDQVIANDGVVSDSVSTSATDDTQSSTSSGKLKPKNLLGLIISRNTREPNIPNPDKMMDEYSKDEKNEEDKNKNGKNENDEVGENR